MGQPQLPTIKNKPIPFNFQRDQFEAKYVQRIKQTPFIDAEIYSSDPLIFVDGASLRLSQLIAPRLNTKQLFPQEQISKIINGILTGLCELQENKYEGHGDVCLENIYYSKKDKLFKLVHPVFNQESGYLLTKHGKRFTSLSPEQLSALAEDSENTEITFQSDIFCLGIALCEVCTLIPTNDIYCPDSYSIFHLEIQKRLKLIEEYYSPVIMKIVSLCLEYDSENRSNAYDLLKMLESSKIKIEESTNRPQIKSVVY